MNDFVGTKEVCRILNIDKSTVSRWVAAGRLTPAFKQEGANGFMLFDRADITAIAAARA